MGLEACDLLFAGPPIKERHDQQQRKEGRNGVLQAFDPEGAEGDSAEESEADDGRERMSREAQWEARDDIRRELFPEAEMSDKDDHPDEEHSGNCGSVEEQKGVFGSEDGEERGRDHAGGGDGEGAARNSGGAEMAKPARGVAASGERK